MRIPWNALQKATVEALLADSTLSALVGSRVYDYLPETIEFPFVTIAEFESEGILDKAGLQSPTLTIEARSAERGKKEVNDCLDAIATALGSVRLSVDGFTVYTAGLLDSAGGDIERWDNGQLVHVGFVRIRWSIK